MRLSREIRTPCIEHRLSAILFFDTHPIHIHYRYKWDSHGESHIIAYMREPNSLLAKYENSIVSYPIAIDSLINATFHTSRHQ
jgi:hypothetical protein